MARHQKVSVVWELLEEPEPGQVTKVLVDVDAPLRPFGAVPLTPPKGILAPGPLEEPTELDVVTTASQRGHRLPR
jgi:hypothetical protein